MIARNWLNANITKWAIKYIFKLEISPDVSLDFYSPSIYSVADQSGSGEMMII